MQNLEQLNAISLAVSSSGLAIGSSANQLSTANATTFLIKGLFYSKTATATFALVIEPNSGLPAAPNSFVTLAAGQACAFLVTLDSAGTFRVAQGPVVQSNETCPVPAVPRDRAACGMVKVVNVTNPFIPGTTNFNAAGVTSTFTSIGTHPGASI